MPTVAAFWIRYGLIYGRLLADAGYPPSTMERIAAGLEHDWRPWMRAGGVVLRREYWRHLARR